MERNTSLKNKGRGSNDNRLERYIEVSTVKCFKNKPEHVALSYCAVAPFDQCQRWDGSTHSHVEADRTCVICEHEKPMGGVDLSDMLLELYRPIRSKKWYVERVYYFLDLAPNNTWLLYRLGRRHMSLMYFNIDICRFLIVSGVINSNRAG